MITENCAVCGIGGALEDHHVIPRSVGGSDDETNILTVCSCCHGKLHGSNKGKRWNASISALTKAGLAKKKEAGVVLGRPFLDVKYKHKIQELQESGLSQGKVLKFFADSDELQTISLSTVRRNWLRTN